MALQINQAGRQRALPSLWDKQSVLLQTRLDYGWSPPSPGCDMGGRVGSRARYGAPAMEVQGALTNVGVLQETADPGFSFQLLVI